MWDSTLVRMSFASGDGTLAPLAYIRGLLDSTTVSASGIMSRATSGKGGEMDVFVAATVEREGLPSDHADPPSLHAQADVVPFQENGREGTRDIHTFQSVRIDPTATVHGHARFVITTTRRLGLFF